MGTNINVRSRFQAISEVNKSRFFIFLIYCFSHGLVALSINGIWWDDWALFYNSEETIRNSFKQSGTFPPYVGDLHVLLTNLGPFSYRTLTFICFYFSSLNFLELIKRYTRCSEQHALLFTLLFTILPFNMARIAAIDLPYTISLTLFLTAWRLYPKNLAVSLVFFFVSFLTQSLLLFMLVIFLIELSIKTKSEISNGLILKLLSLLILPIAYWLIKNIFFKPYGVYEGYNQNIALGNIFVPVKVVILDLLNFRTLLPLNLILFLGTYLILTRFEFKNLEIENRIKWGFFGLITTAIGVLPYLLLGLTPTFKDWNSRHQILMPLGASLMIGAIVIGKSKFHKIALSFVISVSLSFTSINYLAFYKDWNKQAGIITGIKKSPVIDECSVILINDKTNVPNAVGRQYRFYEWNAIFKISTGKQNRFVLSSKDLASFNKGNFDSFYTEEYSAAKFSRSVDNTFCSIDIIYQNDAYSLELVNKL